MDKEMKDDFNLKGVLKIIYVVVLITLIMTIFTLILNLAIIFHLYTEINLTFLFVLSFLGILIIILTTVAITESVVKYFKKPDEA
jgi:hypothetical protein